MRNQRIKKKEGSREGIGGVAKRWTQENSVYSGCPRLSQPLFTIRERVDADRTVAFSSPSTSEVDTSLRRLTKS